MIQCPICGMPGTLVKESRGEREYYYVVHYIDKRRVKHYVGPVDDYVYGDTTNRIDLKGAMNLGRFVVYIQNSIDNIKDIKATPVERAELLKEAITVIENELPELKRLLEEAEQEAKAEISASEQH